ncbi:hypothetical protein Dsin_028054 [Dipteronia sinensis]|uniref:Reverse transcriptase domain-containing protein n=1 Tax=Dipteronia sinensis TaxID=43782 RepID=A0AAD9ZPX4_9ROSI|nr:hypothetical protein Dsin_028054 [Dipteronia sinensis]
MNLLKGAYFGEGIVHLSHLQFGDDTILFLQSREDYLMNTRRIKRCFEVASGLRINFQKSCVVKIRKSDQWEINLAVKFRCASATLPITYLGLPLGGRPCSKIFWSDLIARIQNRLASWKRMFINKGGRLVLIKTVMSSIPIYFMSMFKIQVCIAQISKTCSGVFSLEMAVRRKLHLVKWEIIQKRKCKGGLGVDSVQDKNKGLLAKWA